MRQLRLLSLALFAAASPAWANDGAVTHPDVLLPAASDGVAAEDDDDDSSSVKAEKDALKSAATTPSVVELDDEDRRRRIIMTLQKKNFLKLKRFEGGIGAGAVVNDPFLNRRIINGVLDYHINEVFALDFQGGWAPEFGEVIDSSSENDPDLKQLTKDLLKYNAVAPDISKLTFHGSAALAYSPIYGKGAVFNNIIIFDLFGYFGLGAVRTHDDTTVYASGDDDGDTVELTALQVHPTTVIGGGLRVAFNQRVAARMDIKSMSYIEVVNGGTLEMKNNLIILGSVCFFFPNMQ